MKFQIIRKQLSKEVELIMSGPLNETASFPAIELKDISLLEINCRDIDHVNSIGIRKWVLVMDNLATKNPDLEIHFTGITVPLVQQINTVVGFVPKDAQIDSFFVPFFCKTCEIGENALFRRGKEVKGTDVELPEITCPGCQKHMELDAHAKSYFKFLTMHE